MKILVISSANMDLVMKVSAVPSAGQTAIEKGGYSYVPGGKGANSALAFRRLGADTVFCTCLGNDANGDTLIKVYEDARIDTSLILRSDESPTGLAAIMVEPSGMNRIVVYPGANLALTEEAIDRALACRPDAVFMQLEISHEAIVYAARKASELSIPVFIDAGPADKSFPLSLLPRLAVFSPNETECEIFTGIYPSDEGACLSAARVLESLVSADEYVIKLGERGAYLYSGGKGQTIPSFKVDAVDSTAAGDAFTAALTLKYLEGGDLVAATRYACAVGAITVSRSGASTSIPSADEVEAFLLNL